MAPSPIPPDPTISGWAIHTWNQTTPPETPVALLEDDGSITDTKTRSEAWALGDGSPVVKVDGKAGGYSLWRIFLLPSQQAGGAGE
jgi:hypothetical protein